MEILLDKIPRELKGYPNWVNWLHEEREGKPTKVPIIPGRTQRARSNDPSSWRTFENAMQGYRQCENEHIAGIGFMFTNSGLWGMDLDHCRDPETGIIEAWAMEIIRMANTYAELSPSGTGVHLIGKGRLPSGGRRKGKIEIYDSGRFFTVTGQHIEGTPLTISDGQEVID